MLRILLPVFLAGYSTVLFAQSGIFKELGIGEFPVGFRSTVEFDYAQNYPSCIDSTLGFKKYPKPLIVNVWYPAATAGSAEKMRQRGYMEFQSGNIRIRQWLNRYRLYTEKTIIDQLFGKRKEELDSSERNVLHGFLESKTAAAANAKVAKGKFPLVIYHQGAGASLDDNAVFCEWLASHGYVVMGCSFQVGDGSRMSSGGEEGAVKDIGFLLGYAQKLPNADWMKAAMIGHSLGGQVVNYAAAQGNMPFDAMVSLETTQEYYIGDKKLWPYVTYVSKNAELVNTPFLFASKPYAIHEIADRMKNADRYYLTIPDIGHDEFISQGIMKKFLALQRDQTAVSEEAFRLAKERYTALNKYILAFLNASLKGNLNSRELFPANVASSPGYSPYVEHMAKGATKTIYPGEGATIPTPRQLKFLVQELKTDSVIHLINKFWKKDSKVPIYDPVFAYSMIDHLLTVDRGSAVKLYEAYKNILGRTAVNSQFVYFGRIFSFFSTKEEARAAFEQLLLLDPGNKEEVRKLVEKYLH